MSGIASLSQYGLLAARPAPGIKGQRYYATDTVTEYVDDGTVWQTLTVGTGGGVTAVSGTAPIASSGGTTPAISITAATTGAAGSMSAADKTKLNQLGGVTLFAEGNIFQNTGIPSFNIIQGTNFPLPGTGFVVNDAQFWRFPARAYAGGDITVDVYWYAAATTGNVKFEAALAAVTIGTDTGSLEAKAFATATSTQSAVNANAKAGNKTTITITGASLDSATLNDLLALRLKRIAASASEMAGEAIFQYALVSWQ